MSENFRTILQNVLIQESFCDSKDEAMAIVDSIYLDSVENNMLLNGDPVSEQFLINYLADYFGISDAIAGNLVQKCHMHETPRESHSESHSESSSSNDTNDDCCSLSNNEIDVMNSDDDSIIGSGACELCEREDIKLTRHHMIPKSTYNRIETRLVRILLSDGGLHDESMMNNKAISFQSKDTIFTDSFDHLVPSIMHMIKVGIKSKYGNSKYQAKDFEKVVQKSVRSVLKRQTTDICRPCHSMIHKTYDNITLAHQYNTVDKILECNTLYNFFRWNNKQQRRKR